MQRSLKAAKLPSRHPPEAVVPLSSNLSELSEKVANLPPRSEKSNVSIGHTDYFPTVPVPVIRPEPSRKVMDVPERDEVPTILPEPSR